MNIRKLLQIVTISTITLGLQSSGYAQGNIVNLYDNWTIGSVMSIGGDGPIGIPSSVDIASSTSAIFHPGWANNAISIQYNQFGAIAPVLSGDLATTPGITYEIAFTLYCESAALEAPFVSMSFGDFSSNWRAPAIDCGVFPNSTPLNIDFTVVATSTATTMSFTEHPFDTFGDFYNPIYLSNLSVVAVPEISATRLFGLLGCVLLFAQAPKWIHRRKLGITEPR